MPRTESGYRPTQKLSALATLFLLLLLFTSSPAYALTWIKVSPDGFGSSSNTMVMMYGESQGYLWAGTGKVGGPGGGLWRSANGTSWTQVGSTGFGDVNNRYMFADADFGGNLFVGTGNPTGAELWKSADGDNWTQSGADGFGDSNNNQITPMALTGSLYAGVDNYPAGGEVWRTTNGTDWSQLSRGGFGNSQNEEVRILGEFGGYVYAGTTDYSNPDTGTEVWRSSDGSSWSQANEKGFGSPNNTHAQGATATTATHIYVGTANTSTGGEIWRSTNGTTWSQVISGGFGDANNQRVVVRENSDSSLYAWTANPDTGMEVWRSANGADWSQINEDGFGSANNQNGGGLIALHNGYLYVATSNPVSGGAVWRAQLDTGSTPPTSPPLGNTGGSTLNLAASLGLLALGGLLIGLRVLRTRHAVDGAHVNR